MSTLGALAGATVVMALVSCGAEDIAGQTFTPTEAGTLVVATSLPSPGFWDGADVDHLDGGFERGIAVALADRLELDLRVVDVPFGRLVAGDLGGADLALAQITVTTERAEQVAFSVPYFGDDAGAVVPTGEEITDLKTAQEQRWVVEPGTIEASLLADDVRPDEDPLPCDDVVACVDAVADGRADAALVDLATALVLTNDRDDVTTGGRIVVDGEIAAVLPSDSENVEVVDAALRSMESDGTLDDLAREYLTPVFEDDPDSIPVIRTPA